MLSRRQDFERILRLAAECRDLQTNNGGDDGDAERRSRATTLARQSTQRTTTKKRRMAGEIDDAKCSEMWTRELRIVAPIYAGRIAPNGRQLHEQPFAIPTLKQKMVADCSWKKILQTLQS